jgi:hypothetical protein
VHGLARDQTQVFAQSEVRCELLRMRYHHPHPAEAIEDAGNAARPRVALGAPTFAAAVAAAAKADRADQGNQLSVTVNAPEATTSESPALTDRAVVSVP